MQVPALRAIGLAMLAAVVLLHNRFVLGRVDWRELATMLSIFMVYAAASWVALALFYSRVALIDLGFFFLALDIAVFTLAIRYSGGEHSWLFFLLVVRVADQANTAFRRTLLLAHVAALSYVALILYLAFVDGRAVDWDEQAAKALIIYIVGLYLSLTARTAEQLRHRTSSAIGVARTSILDLKRQSHELVESRERAEAASRVKSEFLSNMSHEVRTPMNGILGMTALVLDTPLSDDQKEYVRTIEESAAALLALVGDILDFSGLEADSLNLESVEFDLHELIGTAARAASARALEKGLEFGAAIGEGVPARVLGDPRRLAQVLRALLGNAVKFTAKGRIDLAAGLDANDDATAMVHFVVCDTGIGVPVAKQGTIFEPFTQGDGSLTRAYGGAGLGLALCERLARLMGGRVWVESAGAGSAFHCTVGLTVRAPSAAIVDPARARPVFDRAATLARLDGSEELLLDIAAAFVEECPRLRAALRAAVRDRDAPAVMEAAHALKGNVSHFSTEGACETLALLETDARKGDLAKSVARMAVLEGQMDALTAALAAIVPERA